MLSVYTRHYAPCKQTDINYRRCHCPKWIQGVLEGKGFVRVSAKTRSWEAAEKKIRKLENPKEIREHVTIQDAVTAFIADERARNLAPASVGKSRSFFQGQLQPWCESRGLKYINQLSPAELSNFRAIWKNASVTTQRKHERMHTLLSFCLRNEWLTKNSMEALKRPKVEGVVPTDYFTQPEFAKIVDTTHIYDFGGGNDCQHRAPRLRALVQLMRWSGLAIMDAVTLERARLSDDNTIFLYRAKTSVPVLVPIPPDVAQLLRSLPNTNPKYFFWSGNGDKRSVVKAYQRSFWKLFKLAELKNADGTPKRCHPHMFRDTFAVELLLAGVPIDQVSILLGHSSVKITEKHYAPFVKARQQQLETYVRMAWQQQGAARPPADFKEQPQAHLNAQQQCGEYQSRGNSIGKYWNLQWTDHPYPVICNCR